MKAIIIALKDLRIAARDRNGFIMLLAMPFVVIAVLGFALSGMFRSEIPAIEPFEVGLVDNDQGDLAGLFREALADPSAKGLMRPLDLDEEEARHRITEGRLAGAVVFPEGYTERILSGRTAALSVLVDPGRSLYPDIIRIAAQTFNDQVFAVQVATRAVVSESAATAMGQDAPTPGGTAVAAEIGRRIHALAPTPVEETAKKGGQVSSFQYYAAAMAVMFLLFAGQAGLQSVIAERRQMTLRRIQGSPGSAWSFAAGKFLGILFIALAQFVILMVGTRLVFGVTWGSNLALSLAVAFSYAVAVSGLAVMVSALVPEEKAGLTVWNLTTQSLAALGGCMWPLAFFPVALQKMATVLPNYWALRGLLDVMVGEGIGRLAPAIGALIAFGLVTLAVGSVRLARA